MTTFNIKPNKPLATLMFLGDIALNDEYNQLCSQGKNPFRAVEPILRQADLVVGNLECFSRGEDGTNPLKDFSLTSEPETLSYLLDLNLGLAGLANNHVYDNLDSGFTRTIRFLEENRISHFGASLNGYESKPFVFEKNGIRIGILNYVTNDTNPLKPEVSKIKLNWFILDRAILDVQHLKSQVDHVVVFPHWGGVMEGSMYPHPALIETSHSLIDAGADLVVGHHSHTLQPYEIYKERYIFYSLGNFCFSDIHKKGIVSQADYKRTRRSAIVKVVFGRYGYQVDTLGVYNTNNHITPDPIPSSQVIRNITARSAWTRCPLTWGLYYFYEMNFYKIWRFFFANQRNPLRQLLKINTGHLKKTLVNLMRTFKSSNH